MTNDSNNVNTLNITKDDVMRIIRRVCNVDGLDAARAAFKQMNEFFSGLKGWAETTDAVYDFFAEKRKEEKQQSREEKLEEQRAAASQFVVLNKAISDAKTIGKAEIDQMDVDVKSPGNTIAKTIKIGQDDEK
jgi:hypothetical protein